MESQCSVASSTVDSQVSEEWSTEEEEEDMYEHYYGGDDGDSDDGGEARDASFQQDPEHFEFSCLSTEETWNFLDSQTREASREVKEEVTVVRVLLQHTHWNLKELARQYSEDKHSLLKASHLVSDDPAHQEAVVLQDACPVCLVGADDCNMTTCSLGCRHMFCSDCWREYISEKVTAGVATGMECMQCPIRLSLEKVQQLLHHHHGDHRLLSRLNGFALSEFVQSHELLRWCPGADCSIVFQVKEPLAKKVTCSKCHSTCCFKCGEAYHCPTSCDMIRQWLLKCRDDSETANYIAANTKDCPKCHSAIEKNGGCNHMNCSQCGYDFCWMCLGVWKDHNGYYNCSKFKANDPRHLDSDKARLALEKYLFYYQRWANHDQSLRLEEETKKKVLDRVEEKVASGSGTWIDWQYLSDGVALLRKCRYTLKYTYPYAYYLDGPRKELFEYQQALLEVEIENLSWKVERAETTDVPDIQQQMNITEVKRLTLLRDFVP